MSDFIAAAHPAYDRWRNSRGAYAGSLNEHWEALLKRDPTLSSVALCVELVFSTDQVVHISDRPCRVVSTASGREYNYAPVLHQRPEITQSYDFMNATSKTRTLTFMLPNLLVDVNKIVQNGRLLAGVGEVSLQIDGGDYDQRFVLLTGDMTDGVSFGSIDELIQISLTDPKDTINVFAPPFIIDATTFATAPAASIGKRYALFIPSYSGVPAPFINQSTSAARALVGYGHVDENALYVVIDGDQYTKSHAIYGYTWVQDYDARVRPVTYVEFGSVGSSTFAFTEQVYVYPKGQQEITNPIDQIRFLLESYTAVDSIGLSEPLFSIAKAKASTLQANILLNAGGAATATALAFIEQNLLRSFPMISMTFAVGGYGPVVTDRRSEITAFVLHADQWPVLHRESLVTETALSDCFNEFVLMYGYDPVEDVYQNILTFDASTSALCEISQSLLGYRPCEIIESQFIFDDGTAQFVLNWMVDHLTLPSYCVEYAVDASMVMHLKPGDNVKITDAEFEWTDLTASVESITYKSSHCVLLLRVWWRYYTLGTAAASSKGKGYTEDDQGQ